MKHFNSISWAFGVLLVASCSDNIYDEPVQENYSKDFIARFGQIDPKQDWNMAERKSVTVDPGSASRVKIYALSGDDSNVYKLVGDYQNVSGRQTLAFDALETVNDFVVVAGNKGRLVKNGESVDFSSALTRTYVSDVENVFTKKNEYKYFTWAEVTSFANDLPDAQNNNTAAHRQEKGLYTDFYAIADGNPVDVYPVFWNAWDNHTVGLYWYDEDGTMHHQDIYSNKDENDVQVYVEWTNYDSKYEDAKPSAWTGVTWNDFTALDPSTNTFGRGRDQTTQNGTINQGQGIRSIGFTINLPAGTKYGFYVNVDDYTTDEDERNNNTNRFYTQASLNPANDDAPNGKSHAVYTHVDVTDENGNTYQRTFLGFEDRKGTGANDNDLNDFMLIFDPAPRLVVDETVNEWIIAAEDMGSDDDYDFNDVVFSVSYVYGSKEATVKMLAAGGTVDALLYRNDNQIGDEVHAWFENQPAAPSGFKHGMINTQSAGPAGKEVTIEVEQDFSLAYRGNTDATLGNFKVKVGDQTSTVITGQKPGSAPQMICVPAGWKWPMERISIDQAYPQFGEWGSNYQTNPTWYENPIENKVLGNTEN